VTERAPAAGLPGPVDRPEFEHAGIGKASTADVARPLSVFERLSNVDPVRKFTVLVSVIVLWQLYTRAAKVPPLIFPTFWDTVVALWKGFVDYGLAGQIWASMGILLAGYAIGLLIAAVLSFIAVSSRSGWLSTPTTMAPSAAMILAVARPMPLATAVIRTTLSLKRIVSSRVFSSGARLRP